MLIIISLVGFFITGCLKLPGLPEINKTSCTISVTHPIDGLNGSDICNIEWDYNGPLDKKGDIYLIGYNQEIQEIGKMLIAENVSLSDGSYLWGPYFGLAIEQYFGTDINWPPWFKIKIESVGCNCYAYFFSVCWAPSVGTVFVTNPGYHDSLVGSGTCNIEWSYNGPTDKKGDIILIGYTKESQEIGRMLIAEDVSLANESYLWGPEFGFSIEQYFGTDIDWPYWLEIEIEAEDCGCWAEFFSVYWMPSGIISNPKDRAAAALKAVEDFYNLFTLPNNLPKDIILAIIAGETGRNYDFNNELIAYDWGRGLMQITTNSFVGAGSGGCSSSYCFDCRGRNEEACYRYYSNTEEGINKNIRDGYYALAEKYRITKYCANCTGYENITPEEICWISVVQQYNTGYREHPSKYTNHIGEILKNSLSWNWYHAEGVENDPFLGNKFIEAYNNKEEVILCSSAYLLIYDSQGNATGLIDDTSVQEIPNSIYDPNSFYDNEREIAVIFFPSDSYRYNVVGIEDGSYSLTINSTKEGDSKKFEAIEIPTTVGVIYQYTIDWEMLSEGEEGVTVQMDFDGDGTPELTVTTESIFTFVPAEIDIDPDTLSLKSRRKWVTAYIELPGGYDVVDIDVGTVKLWYEGTSIPAEWGDIQDGTLMIKFDGEAVRDLFPGSVDTATVAVAGELQDGTPFGGNDTIRVIEKP